MITIEDIVRAARLSPTVGPFTVRRLFLRARVFADGGGYSAADLRAILPILIPELREILQAHDVQSATAELNGLADREEKSGSRARGSP